ncbi:MAG: ArsA family ATPase, partial [Gaiellales bacterium]
EACERILSNRIYRQLSGAVAGSQEYMAMEKVYELHRSGLYDLLVLDTPPTRNALDFLEAPGRLTRFIEGKTLRLLLRPGARVLGSGSALAFKVLERLTGMALLRDLSEFLAGFDGMYDGFRERADRVSKLLASKDTTFLLVTVPEEEPIAEADFFWRALVEHGMPFGGVIVNKVHPSYITGRRSRRSLRPRAEQELIGAGATAATAARAAENLMHYQALADRDRANIERLARRIGSEPLIEVPHLDHDVHDLDGLAQVGTHLYG